MIPLVIEYLAVLTVFLTAAIAMLIVASVLSNLLKRPRRKRLTRERRHEINSYFACMDPEADWIADQRGAYERGDAA